MQLYPYGEFHFSKIPKSPDVFFKKAYAETEEVTDTVYVVTMAGQINGDSYSFNLLMWKKNKEGNYYPEIYRDKFMEEEFDIKYK